MKGEPGKHYEVSPAELSLLLWLVDVSAGHEHTHI